MYALALVLVLVLQPVVNSGKGHKAGQTASHQPTASPAPANAQGIPVPSAQQGETKTYQHQENPNGNRYAVEIKRQPSPEDTPLFKWYLLATAFGVAVNAFIWVAILRQTKLNVHQLRVNFITAKAAVRGARAAKLSADASQDTVGSLSSQLVEMQKAAEASAKSAVAATKSADALVNSERAWIFAGFGNIPLLGGIFHHNLSDGSHTTHINLSFKCWNEGKTPAWIDEVRCCLRFFTTIPTTPQIELCEPMKISPEAVGPSKESQKIDFSLECDGRGEQGETLIAYGFVDYRDMFGDTKRRTTFWLRH
jgi:hypothetical protein